MGQYVTSLFKSKKEGKIPPSLLRIIVAQGLVFLTGIATIATMVFTQETLIYTNYPVFYLGFFLVTLSFLQALILQRSIYNIAGWLTMGIVGAIAVYFIDWASYWMSNGIIGSFLSASFGLDRAGYIGGAFVFIFAAIVFASLQSIWLINPSCYQRKLRLAARTNKPTFSSKPWGVTE